MTSEHLKYLFGRHCIDCGLPTELVTGNMVYPHRPDLYDRSFYMCPNCMRFVGTHKESKQPLGSIADGRLATVRKNTHSVFDPLWKDPKYGMTRKQAYGFLAGILQKPIDLAHIGMLTVSECEVVQHAITVFMMNHLEYEWLKEKDSNETLPTLL